MGIIGFFYIQAFFYKMVFRVVTENPSSDVDFYITSELNVSKYRKSDTQALFLRPDWIWHCHNELEFVSTDDYEL